MPRQKKTSNRFLPKYVSRFDSQHGTERYRFRRKGYPTGYFTAPLGTEEFREEYHSFLHPDDINSEPKPVFRAKPGTIDDLLDRYMSVPERLGPTPVTQNKIRAILEDFRLGRGSRPVALVTFDVIEKIVAKKMVKTGTGNRTKGGPHAAIKLRKELKRLFAFAAKTGMIDHNPAADAQKVKIPASQKTNGFHSWTEDEILQYRDHWRIGTRERLAMELLLWTDQRRSDVATMGMAQVKNGRIPVTQGKTGKKLWLLMPPQLLEAIVALPPEQSSPFCFIVSRKGVPYTKESFGNWFKEACVEAGLPHCSAHGLRKASLRRMAELEMANKTMKSVSGQSSDRTLAIYTDDANQTALADAAIRRLAAWETGVHEDKKKAAAND